MHNSKPPIFRQIRACVYSHFSAWLHSPRTIVMGVVILCFAYMHARSYGYTLSMRGYTAHLGEMVFNYLDSGFADACVYDGFLCSAFVAVYHTGKWLE